MVFFVHVCMRHYISGPPQCVSTVLVPGGRVCCAAARLLMTDSCSESVGDGCVCTGCKHDHAVIAIKLSRRPALCVCLLCVLHRGLPWHQLQPAEPAACCMHQQQSRVHMVCCLCVLELSRWQAAWSTYNSRSSTPNSCRFAKPSCALTVRLQSQRERQGPWHAPGLTARGVHCA